MSVFSTSISETGDDGYAIGGVTDTWVTANTSNAIGNSGGSPLSPALRFQSVTIPQGATINSAAVEFVASQTVTNDVVAVISCNDADDAGAITNYADWEGRARTTANTAWNLSAAQTSGSPVTSPNFATSAQEVIDRAGWASGNDLMPMFDDNGTASGVSRNLAEFAHATLDPASIDIDYTEASFIPPPRNGLGGGTLTLNGGMQ